MTASTQQTSFTTTKKPIAMTSIEEECKALEEYDVQMLAKEMVEIRKAATPTAIPPIGFPPSPVPSDDEVQKKHHTTVLDSSSDFEGSDDETATSKKIGGRGRGKRPTTKRRVQAPPIGQSLAVRLFQPFLKAELKCSSEAGHYSKTRFFQAIEITPSPETIKPGPHSWLPAGSIKVSAGDHVCFWDGGEQVYTILVFYNNSPSTKINIAFENYKAPVPVATVLIPAGPTNPNKLSQFHQEMVADATHITYVWPLDVITKDPQTQEKMLSKTKADIKILQAADSKRKHLKKRNPILAECEPAEKRKAGYFPPAAIPPAAIPPIQQKNEVGNTGIQVVIPPPPDPVAVLHVGLSGAADDKPPLPIVSPPPQQVAPASQLQVMPFVSVQETQHNNAVGISCNEVKMAEQMMNMLMQCQEKTEEIFGAMMNLISKQSDQQMAMLRELSESNKAMANNFGSALNVMAASVQNFQSAIQTMNTREDTTHTRTVELIKTLQQSALATLGPVQNNVMSSPMKQSSMGGGFSYSAFHP